MQTQMGHIADALTQTKENKTPLQLRLSQLSRILTWLVLGVWMLMQFRKQSALQKQIMLLEEAVEDARPRTAGDSER